MIGSIFTFCKIDPETLNVDRWSVISSFWDKAFNGEYPYLAKSHLDNYPGPMPFYFILALPFYLIGELGYFSLVGLISLILISKKLKVSLRYELLILLFVLTSFFYLWEVSTRSNLFTTSFIVLTGLSLLTVKPYTIGNKVIFILLGLLLSTRAIFVLPYIIFYLYILRFKIFPVASFLKLSILSAAIFFSTFSPFLLLYPKEFSQMNPFIIQSTFFLPYYYNLVFIIISIVFSFLVRNIVDLYYYSGLSLFLAIFIYASYHVVTKGFYISYVEAKVDISYFIFCIPFFLVSLLIQKGSYQTKPK